MVVSGFTPLCCTCRCLTGQLNDGWHAGVYFEKYVKGKLGQTLWIRNLQLSIYGVPLSLAYTYLRDGR